MACGEGYGTAELARRAARVTGVDANPEAFEHARLKYTRPGVRFERDLVESWSGECDAVVFLQTIEHVENPKEVLEHFRSIAPAAYVSTPNVLTLAPEGAEKSGQPLAREGVPRGRVPRAVRVGLRLRRALRALPRAQAVAAREGDRGRVGFAASRGSGSRSASTTGSRRRSAMRTSRCATGAARPGARLRRGAPMSRDRGALALVLHTHMPYVEGFGTWPFGEEWLWEAVASVYLPLLDVLEGAPVTVSLTPVLCDQLEAMRGEAGDRYLRFLREIRAPIHAEDSTGLDATGKPELAAELRRAAGDYARADEAVRAPRPRPARCVRRPRHRAVDLGRHARGAAAARHRRRPAAAGGRRGGRARAPLRRGLERRLLAARVRVRAGARARPRRARRARVLRRPDRRLRPRLARPPRARRDRDRPGRGADRLGDGRARLGGVGLPLARGLPRLPRAHAARPEAVGERRRAVRPRARAGARPRARARLRRPRSWHGSTPTRPSAAARGSSAARSTPSCSATGGTRDRAWLARRPRRGGRRRGSTWSRCPRGSSASSPWSATLAASTWGSPKDLSTWDSARVAEIAFAARGAELETGRGGRPRPARGPALERAARELLALQASDWAFLLTRELAADYPLERVRAHQKELRAALGALDSAPQPDPELRSLLPELDLAPLVSP